MKKAILLELLKNQAAELQLPLDRLYMHTLRRAFCQHVSWDPAAYQAWADRILGNIAMDPDRDRYFLTEVLPAGSISELLLLGDICAADQERTGSYYTPASVARYMAGSALRQTLEARFPDQALLAARYFDGKNLVKEDARLLQELMLQLRILDMACGNGVFLTACLDWYCGLGAASGEDGDGLLFVAQSLCGMDIRSDALESWAISLGSRSPRFLSDLPSLNTACISTVDGDGVLKIPWVKEILEARGFDLVIGNPPYLGEKGNRQLFLKLRESTFGQQHYEGRMDLFYYFIHRGIDLLKPGGILCQLTTSYYATADFAAKLRERLRTEGGISAMVSFNDQRVFAGALGHHLILFYQKAVFAGKAEVITYTGARRLSAYNFEDLFSPAENPHFKRHTVEDRRHLFDPQGHMILDPARWDTDDLERLNSLCPDKLRDLVRINQGIVSGADRSDSGGIFVLEAGEAFEEAEPWLVPWYKNGDIRRYCTAADTEKRLLYIGNEEADSVPDAVLAHFAPYKEKLSRRRECLSGARPWYGLQWPRDREIFEGPKLVAPQRCGENRFAYSESPWFASADVYFLTRPVSGVSLFALLAYLNSDVMLHWFLHCGKRKGKQLELYATPLGNVPVCRSWLLPGEELDQLGRMLYEAAGNDGDRVSELRGKVEAWLSERLMKNTFATNVTDEEQ